MAHDDETLVTLRDKTNPAREFQVTEMIWQEELERRANGHPGLRDYDNLVEVEKPAKKKGPVAPPEK